VFLPVGAAQEGRLGKGTAKRSRVGCGHPRLCVAASRH
jgi:hypothetical protein